jgi:hypothetical protein
MERYQEEFRRDDQTYLWIWGDDPNDLIGVLRSIRRWAANPFLNLTAVDARTICERIKQRNGTPDRFGSLRP